MNIKIAICDDEKTETQYLNMLVNKWAKERDVFTTISIFESAESFLFHYADDKDSDILLLDIQMKNMNGIELAKHIRNDNESVQIVFITGFPDFIAEGYDVLALHYLMKPVNIEKLMDVLDKALNRLHKIEKSLFFNIDGENMCVPLKEIIYIESQGHYIFIKTQKNEYRLKMNLSDVEKSLDDSFFRYQRSFIVSLKHIRKTTRTAVFLEKDIEIPMSRGLYDEVNQALINYFT